MTRRTAQCPNCGAMIEFVWADAVQTTCSYCRSILVRHDVDLEQVGTAATLPLTPSPIQLGTEGRYNGDPFTVIGRLVYEWERGGWSEWHFRMETGKSGWLSDAQADYEISFLAQTTASPPLADNVKPGTRLMHGPVSFAATSVTRAHYTGTEGELPFEYWDKREVVFADFRAATGAFATLDYSEEPPLLFVGEPVDLDKLDLRNMRPFEGW